jgi:pimeloyl-ACP methyl ester carboxylesterase
MLNRTICHLFGDSNQVALVVHDWGSIIGMIYQNKYPTRVSRMVIFDVGIKKQLSVYDGFVIVLYQWWFATAYIFSQILGNAIGKLIFYSYFLLSTALPILSPVGNSKLKSTRPRAEISVHMAYPYFHFWKSMISLDKSISYKFPTCNVLYMVR